MSLECTTTRRLERSTGERNGGLAEPIFVVGMNGSGTTMLLDCLDSHPNLFGFPYETRLLPYFFASVQKYGDLDRDENFLRLWNDIRDIPAFRYVYRGRRPALPADWQSVPRSLVHIVDRIFAQYAQEKGKRRWCEKTPMHALHMVRLAELFPNARFIHIIRDGRACAASFHRRWRFTPELTMYRWKNVVREARRQGALLPGQYLEFHYEDFIVEPRYWMEKVCEFVGEPFVNEVVAPSRVRNFTGTEAPYIVRSRRTWHDYFDQKTRVRLDRIGGKMLASLGYRTDSAEADWDPGWLVRMWWFFRDFLHFFDRLNWTESLARVVAAFKQRATTRF